MKFSEKASVCLCVGWGEKQSGWQHGPMQEKIKHVIKWSSATSKQKLKNSDEAFFTLWITHRTKKNMVQQKTQFFQEGRTLNVPVNYWAENMMVQSCQLYLQLLQHIQKSNFYITFLTVIYPLRAFFLCHMWFNILLRRNRTTENC